MTNIEILTKAVQKAIDSGWGMFGFRIDDYIPPWHIVKGGQMPTPKVVEKWVPENSLLICDYNDHYYLWEHLIFNHDFAKALWGEPPKPDICLCGMPISKPHSMIRGSTHGRPLYKDWQYHLQQLVIADDPIKYLGERLND